MGISPRIAAKFLTGALFCVTLLAPGRPADGSVSTPQKSLRALGGRQVWVPICSRRGVNGSAAYFDNTNTAVMDQVSCTSSSFGTVTALKLVYAAFDMPQQGEVDRPVTATGTAAVYLPAANALTAYSSTAAASGSTTLTFSATSLSVNGISAGQTISSFSGSIAAGSYVVSVANSFVAGPGNTPTTTVVTLSTATSAATTAGQAFAFSGAFAAAKFGGRRQFTIEPAHDVVTSDPIAVLLAPGAQFFVRTSATAPVGLQLMDYPGTGSRLNGEFDSRGTSPNDQTMTPVVLTNSGGGYWCPSAVLALVTLSPGQAAPGGVLVLGDSIAAGTGDNADALGLQGYIQRSLENATPFISAARGSTTAFGLLAHGDGQYALSVDAGITDVLLEDGRNDISAYQITDSALRATVGQIAARYVGAGKRVWCFTLTPTTQSNDGWTTLANQSWTVAITTTGPGSAPAGSTVIPVTAVTGLAVGQSVSGTGVAPATLVTVVGSSSITVSIPTTAIIAAGTKLSLGSATASVSEGYRTAYNTALRAQYGTLGCAGLVDVDATVSDAGKSGKWRVDLGAASADGVHPSAALHQALVNAGVVAPAMFLAQ